MANTAEVQIFIDETMLDALSNLKDENERLHGDGAVLIAIIIRLQGELARLTCNCGKPNITALEVHDWSCRYRWIKSDVYDQAEAARQRYTESE